MADKLRQGVSVATTFVAGEQPTAEKLNSITAQLRYAAENLEKAVGDIHSQSWPYSSSSITTLSQPWGRERGSGDEFFSLRRKLDIANLARLVGPASNLNPRAIQPGAGYKEVEENVPVGFYEFSLRYPPRIPANVVFSDNAIGEPFHTWKALTALVDDGDYHVTSLGKVYCVLPSLGTATYEVDPLAYEGIHNYPHARFNVIPDPHQVSSGLSLQVGALGALFPDRHAVTLVPITHQQSNIDGSSTELTDYDLNKGVYLSLPKVLTDDFTAEEAIPAGFLFLKNETSGEVYEDAEYYYNSPNSILVGNRNLTDEITAGHRFSIITVGCDITTSIDDLRNKFYHKHDRTFGEPFVALEGISGFTSMAGNSGPWVPSEIPGNFAPQYLHRDGWKGVAGDNDLPGYDDNLNDQNAMRGHLLLGLSDGPAGSHVGTSGESYALIFGGRDSGDILDAPKIYRDADGHTRFYSQFGSYHNDFYGGLIRPMNVNAGFAGPVTSSSTVFGVSSASVINMKIFAFEAICTFDSDINGLIKTSLYLADFDGSPYKVASLDIMVAKNISANEWVPSGGPSSGIPGENTKQFYKFDESNREITIYVLGSDWEWVPSVPVDVAVRVVVHYSHG